MIARIRPGIKSFGMFIVLILLVGCSDNSKVMDGKIEGYNKLVEQIESVTTALSFASSSNPLQEQLKKADAEKRTELAMYLADDMAIATTFDLVTDEILAISGEAVKAYPHPLLLNNYASMLYGIGNKEDALFFYTQALNQEPDNPILLTNIANLYLEQENYEAAKDFASRALQTMSDYGPAYQVMTTVHLQAGDSELAAETMVKSAKYNFNDVTIHHFDSFLGAVGALDPAVDEYPLKEEFIDELYEIASTNVDTKDVNASVDTPASQITIQPFPTIGSADHLMKMENYLRGEGYKIRSMWDETHSQSITLGNAYSHYMDADDPTADNIPILKHLRQYYAYKVLESFYEYKLERLDQQFNQRLDEYGLTVNDQIDALNKEYEEKVAKAEEVAQEAAQQMMADLFSGKNPNLDEVNASMINVAQVELEWEQKKLDIQKRFAEKVIADSQQLYNESKQIVEEFWLRSGGIVKYMVVKEVFDYVNTKREMFVFDHTGDTFASLADTAMSLNFQKRDAGYAKQLLQIAQKNANALVNKEEKPETGEEMNGEDLTPQIEKESLATYPEAYDTGEIIIEKSFFGYSFSLSYNGETIDASYDSLFEGGAGIQWSPYTPDQYKTYTLNDVKMEGNTAWFKDSKTVKNALGKSGKLGEAVGKLGKIGIGFINHTREGEYVVKRWGGAVIDKGTLYVREKGGSIGEYGRTDKVEVIRSQMTGIAEKKTSVKHNFMFAGISTSP